MWRTTKTGALVALLWAAPALAGPGNGIRFGGSEGRLHPYLEIEGRYDSNVFLTAGTGGESKSSFVLHFRPGVRLDVPGDPAKVFFDGQLDWAQYTGSGLPSELSKLYGSAVVGVRVNEGGSVSLDFEDAFRRLNWTPSLSLREALVTNYNTLRASLPWTPGGGALVLTTSGQWVLEAFEPLLPGQLVDGVALSKYGYSEIQAGEELNWRFLPRTSATFEANYFDRLPNSSLVSRHVRGLRVIAGATGLVTPHFAATAKAGYGDTLQSAGIAFRTWLAYFEGEWIGNELMRARAGYEHGMGSDPGAAFAVYRMHRAWAEGRLALAAKVEGKLRAEWQRRDYPSLEVVCPPLTGTPGPSGGIKVDQFRIEPTVEAELARWARVGVGYAYTTRDSSSPNVTLTQGFNYAKHEAWLRLTFTY
jgi:hypothetical protein